jgi:hypothetical protein
MDHTIRHARLWQDHVFSTPSLDYREVQRQMVMFVTMYSMIDQDVFSFMSPRRAEKEWNRIREHKKSFIEGTLAEFTEKSTCEVIGNNLECRNFYGYIQCDQCLLTTKSTTVQETPTNLTEPMSENDADQEISSWNQKVVIKSKEIFETSKQWTESVFSSQLATCSSFYMLIFAIVF